jgi:hypothetical protein
MFNFNKNCHWSHDWEKWSKVESRSWQTYGNSDQTFLNYYQRRECRRCGKIEEREVRKG